MKFHAPWIQNTRSPIRTNPPTQNNQWATPKQICMVARWFFFELLGWYSWRVWVLGFMGCETSRKRAGRNPHDWWRWLQVQKKKGIVFWQVVYSQNGNCHTIPSTSCDFLEEVVAYHHGPILQITPFRVFTCVFPVGGHMPSCIPCRLKIRRPEKPMLSLDGRVAISSYYARYGGSKNTATDDHVIWMTAPQNNLMTPVFCRWVATTPLVSLAVGRTDPLIPRCV